MHAVMSRVGPVVAIALGCLIGASPAAAAGGKVYDDGAGELRYVAMGDSAASGPGLLPIRDVDCQRSTVNYPTLVAALLPASAFTDVTCSGAKTTDFYEAQSDVTAPQLDALGPDTTLVTVGPIASNDVGVFGRALACLNPLPPGCAASAAAEPGGDPIVAGITAVAPKVDRMLKDIRARAPEAEVFVVGYGRYFSPGGCFPYVPIQAPDADHIQDLHDRLDTMLAARAAANGMTFVDLRGGDAVDHSTCAPPGTNYLQFLNTTDSAVVGHPTALGMAAYARRVATAIRARLAEGGILRPVLGLAGRVTRSKGCTVRVVVANDGRGVARDVVLKARATGPVRLKQSSFPIGRLDRGQRRITVVRLRPRAGRGAVTVRMTATAGGSAPVGQTFKVPRRATCR